jgi:hypothetical protein
MQSKDFPWWGWLLVLAGSTAGALDLNWFAAFGWNVGVSAPAQRAIDIVEDSQGGRSQPQLPVEEAD